MDSLHYYLADVLGIKNFLSDHLDEAPTSTSFQYKCSFFTLKEFSPEALEMFLKMTEAMGLKRQDFLLTIHPQEFAQAHSAVQVEFLEEVQSQIGMWQKNKIQTLSPHFLLQEPTQKKLVWTHLQQVMKKMN